MSLWFFVHFKRIRGTPARGRHAASCRIAAIDHDGLDLAGTAAAEGGGPVVVLRGEAGHALLEGRKLDHHEAMEFARPLHDPVAAAPRQDLAAVFGDDARHEISVFLVVDRIVDLRARDPIGGHVDLTAATAWLTPSSFPR